jgi:hypothetical protein
MLPTQARLHEVVAAVFVGAIDRRRCSYVGARPIL